MGLSFCLYTLMMWLTHLDSTWYRFGRFLDIAIILLPILLIFYVLKYLIRNETFSASIPNRMLVSIVIGTVSYLIYDPFLWLYHHIINPDWFSYVIQFTEQQLREAHTDESLVKTRIEGLRLANLGSDRFYRLGTFMASGIILPILISLLSLIFIRNKAGLVNSQTTRKEK